jgi:hypothetical protein
MDAGADINFQHAVCPKFDTIIVASTLVYFFAYSCVYVCMYVCVCVCVCVCVVVGVNPERGLHCEQGGETPLHNACQSGSVEVAEMLIRAGADIYISDKVCRFPVMCGYEWACSMCKTVALRILSMLLYVGVLVCYCASVWVCGCVSMLVCVWSGCAPFADICVLMLDQKNATGLRQDQSSRGPLR